MVPLRYELKSGDSVEVVTQSGHRPSRDWLKFAKTSRAKAKIRLYIREEQQDKAKELGRELLTRELERYESSLSAVLKGAALERFMAEKGYRGVDHLLTMVGYGRVTPLQVLQGVLPPEQLNAKQAEKESVVARFFKKALKSKGLIRVAGYDDILVSLGRCCNPIPGDSIVGFISRGQGVKVHAITCGRVLATDPARRIPVSWDMKEKVPIATKIRVVCVDKPGLLADISKSISAQGVNIANATCRAIGDQKAMNTFEVGIEDINHLHHLIKALEKVKGVITVERVRE